MNDPKKDIEAPSARFPETSSGPSGRTTAHGPGNYASSLSSLKLPGPGYELESLPATPTMLDRSDTSLFALHSNPTFSSPFSRYPSREITSTPAISSDPTHAFRISPNNQTGGFYMHAEDSNTRPRQHASEAGHLSGLQMQPASSLDHYRSRTRDTDQDYFSMSSNSAGSLNSSYSSHWNQDSLVSPHTKEDSGYALFQPSFPDANSNATIAPQLNSSIDSRVRQRPSLRLYQSSALYSSRPISNDATGQAGTVGAFDFATYDDNPFPTGGPQVQNNLTPRMSTFPNLTWPSEQPDYSRGMTGDILRAPLTQPSAESLFRGNMSQPPRFVPDSRHHSQSSERVLRPSLPVSHAIPCLLKHH